MAFVLFLGFLFFLSPNNQKKVREGVQKTRKNIRETAVKAREKVSPYVEQYAPNLR
jgi:hypothetical protein